MFNFFRVRKFRKSINTGASFILEDFATIVSMTINGLEKENRIKNALHKEVLKFECTALLFWFFRLHEIFPEAIQKLVVNEVHQLYFSRLRKSGYNSNQVQMICDDLTDRYKLYDSLVNSSDDFVKVGTNFARFVAERAKINIDIAEVMIPVELIKKVETKFNEYRRVMQT